MRPEQLVWRCGGCGGVELGLLPPGGEAGDERRGETLVKHGRRRKAGRALDARRWTRRGR